MAFFLDLPDLDQFEFNAGIAVDRRKFRIEFIVGQVDVKCRFADVGAFGQECRDHLKLQDFNAISQRAGRAFGSEAANKMSQIVAYGIKLPSIDNELLDPISDKYAGKRLCPLLEGCCVARKDHSVKIAIEDNPK